MNQNIREKMVQQALRQLEEIRRPKAASMVKNAAKKALGQGGTNRDMIFWPAGLLLLGLWEAGRYAEIRAYLEEWIRKGSRVSNPDDALSGEVLLRLYEESGREDYKDAAQQIFLYLKECRRDAAGAIVYGQRSSNTWIYADGAGQVSMFLAHYGRLFGEEEALLEGTKQLLLFSKFGMDTKSALPYHGYDEKSGNCYGIIGWGRAVGWLLFGFSEWLLSLPQKGADWTREDEELFGVLLRMICAIRERIREDGMLSWQLDCSRGPLDTSATGMIFYSLLRINQRAKSLEGASLLVTEPEVLKKAAEALLNQTDADGRVLFSSAECIDFAQYRQTYATYPWGQGAVLAFLSAYDKEK